MFRPYVDVLRTPGVSWLLAGVALSAAALGLLPLALVLLLGPHSAALGGFAAGAFGLGNAVGVPLQGWLIDRMRPAAAIAGSAACSVAALLAALGASHGGSAALTLALLAVSGVAFPAITAAVRARLPAMLRGGAATAAAYALLSMLFQGSLALGPLLTAASVALGSPAIAVLGAAGLVAVAAGGYATTALSQGRRAAKPVKRNAARVARGDVARMLPVVAISGLTGFAAGALTVVVGIWSREAGHAGFAGVVLACLAAGEAAGALVFGARRPRLGRRMQLVAALVAVALLYVAGVPASRSPVGFALLAVTIGAALSPVAIIVSLLLDELVAPGAVGRAFTAVVAAGVGGSALGSASSGVIASGAPLGVALLAACAACLAAAAIAALMRLPGSERISRSWRGSVPHPQAAVDRDDSA